MTTRDTFSLLCRPIRKLIAEKGFEKPTEPQEKAIPFILRGENVLLIAPTATGKTEAAVLPILHRLITKGERGPGIKIIYITPLRALNRDLLDRLIWWCRKLDVKLAVRHGDTPVPERSKQARSPPDMLITTPETMQSILAGFVMRKHLRAVRWVVVDEVHELADNKRGSQLSLTLERLRWVTGEEFQLVGLSATIGSPSKVAKFLVGSEREVRVVDVSVARKMQLKVVYPQPSAIDYDLAREIYTRPEVAARLRLMKQLLKGIRSALLFTNTRSISEILASRFKVWDLDFPVSIHHGSLAKPSRVAAEQGLKGGELKGLICVAGGSRVLLSDGSWKDVRDMEAANDPPTLLSLGCNLKIVPDSADAVIKTGRRKIVRIVTETGFQLRCTPDHRFLSMNGDGKLVWIKAADLNGKPVALVRKVRYQPKNHFFVNFIPDDVYVRISPRLRKNLKSTLREVYGTYAGIGQKIGISAERVRSYLGRGKAMHFKILKDLLEISSYSVHRVRKEITGIGFLRGRKFPQIVDRKIARLLGFHLADGSISRKDMIRLVNSDIDLLRRYVKILKEKFNLNCHLRWNGETWVARTHATWLCKILQKMGIPSGRKAKVAKVPNFVFSSSPDVIHSFLAGYFDDDGFVEVKDNKVVSVGFSTSSSAMAKDLQLLLLNIGVLSSLRISNDKYSVVALGGLHVRGLLKNCTFWRKLKAEVNELGYSHRDVIPNIGRELKSLRERTGLSTYLMKNSFHLNPYRYERNQRAITRSQLRRLIVVYRKNNTHVSDYLENLARSDIFWDYVTKINGEGEGEVYDIVNSGNSSFIANGFITHNCTSSLELGIDIGRIDLVIQYMSPRQVTRLVQRVGRSGHRIGRVAKGVIITMDSDDTLEALVICRRAYQEKLEEVEIPEKPYDVLMNQFVALLIQRRRWYFYELMKLFRKSYPYRDLNEEDIKAVVERMHGRFPRLAWVSFEDTVLMKPRDTKSMYRYFFNQLSMIPDEKNYIVIDDRNDTPVGILHEAFVAEYGEPGIKFILRGAPWQILSIFEDRIYVKPIKDPTGAIPSWVGEEIPVPFEVALEVGSIRRSVEEALRKGEDPKAITRRLAERYPADEDTMSRALSETFRQVEKGYMVPTDRRITVEEWEDVVVIGAHFGSRVNRTLSRLIGYTIGEELGRIIGVQQDPYRIVIKTMGEAGASDVIQTIQDLPHERHLENKIIDSVKRSGLFKRRMIHVARRFGALSKWANFSNISLAKVMKSFEGTAIFDEAVRDVMREDIDVGNTVKVLDKIKEGEIEVVEVKTERRELTPISMLGIERIGRRADIIPPERMKHLFIESTKARILNEFRTLVCTKCGHTKTSRINDLSDVIKCPECGSLAVGIVAEPEEVVEEIGEKRGRGLTKKEQKLWDTARKTAEIVEQYGKVAAAILAGKRLGPEDAEAVLWEEDKLSDRLFEIIMDAERRAMRRRF